MNFLVCFSIIVLLHECLCSPCKTYTEETLLEDPSVIDFFWDPINETVDEASRDNLDKRVDKSIPNFSDETLLENSFEKFLKETLEEPVDNLDNPRDKSEPNFLDETLLEDPLVKFIWDTVEKPVDNVSGDNLDKSVDKSVPKSHESLEPVVKSFQDTFEEASVNHTDKDKSLEKSGPNSNKFLEDELDTVFRNGFKEPIDKASGDNLDKTVHKSVPNFTPLIKYIVDTVQECVDSVVRDNLDKSLDKSVPNSDNPLEDPVVKAFLLDTYEEVPEDHSDKDKSLNKSGSNSNESLEDALVTHYQNAFKEPVGKVSGDKTDRPVDKSVPNFLDEPLRKTSHDETFLDIFDEPLDTVLRDNLRKQVDKLVLNDVLSDPLDKFSRGS